MSGEQENTWRTPNFRTSVVNKINEAIVQSGMTSAKNSIDMENHVYQKSRTKDEYLSYVARLILHVREMNKSKGAQNQQQTGQNPNAQDPTQQMTNQQAPNPQQQAPGNMGGMQDPINALQTLATQGTRGPPGPPNMMGGVPQQQQQQNQQQPPSNLLQSLTQQRPMQGMNPQMVGMQQQRPVMPGAVGQMSGGNMTMNMQQQQQQHQGQMMGVMNQGMGPQGQMQHAGAGGQMMNPQMASQMGGMNPGGMVSMRQPVPGGMNPAMMQQQQQQMAASQGQMNPMMMNPNMARTPGVPSPINPMSQQGMIPSPAMVASPNPQGMMNRPQIITPSPSQPLNTPMRPGETAPSPLNPHDEQLYREKYRQLTKYIEPLKRMITRMGNDDGDRLQKMKKLLEILSNPNSRIPLETLLKCETALENQLGAFKEHTINNPLLEAISANMQTPLANHTLQRTFRPCLESLFGSDIKTIPLPSRLKRMKLEEDTQNEESGPEISHILQGEIARLDSKFKITLDPAACAGSKSVKLICWLDDKHLPCVPPINVTIPRDYPKSSPECFVESEYEGTDFLKTVQQALTARILKLPKIFTLSQLLDTWEMALRQACAPKLVAPTQVGVIMNV
ncbi:mediator of RNA polymerase II transcription subunit 15 [Culicoides brevitarsis]|uniref:mediator of RNA polymerase II transcription subunit 15 n=1 Tax=Culicoides brevitarsis TaxID=469753 RepID=UPI00307BCBF5